jgi:hypothetical protein
MLRAVRTMKDVSLMVLLHGHTMATVRGYCDRVFLGRAVEIFIFSAPAYRM